MNLEKYPMKPNGMYVLKKSDFDDIAEMILKEYMPAVLYRPQAVDIEYLAEECFYLDIKYDCIQPDGKVLGMIAFADDEDIGEINLQILRDFTKFSKVSFFIKLGSIAYIIHKKKTRE